MKIRYLFPCPHCHTNVPLVTTQAGQDIQCDSCQDFFEAPKLQQIKACPLVEEGRASERNHVSSFAGRAIIVAGLVLLITGSLAGGALYFYANSMVFELNIEENKEFIQEKVAAMDNAEVYREWYYVEGGGDLGEWFEAPPLRYRAQGLILRNIAYGLLGMAAIGLGTFLFGVFFYKK